MGGSRVLVVLGGLVAVAVGVGLWLALGTGVDPADPDGRGGTVVAPVDAVGGVSPADRAKRVRAKHAGSAAITGVVKRRDGAAPAAGQDVSVVREGFDAWTATADETGGFRVEGLPDGGPFEVRVEAKGFATVRIPGIGLGRGESRDVGTLWLDRAVRLPVAVRDWADRPIAGAEVKAFVAPDYGADFDWSKAWAQMALEPVAVAKTTTDAKGTAVFEEMASGRWTFVATAPGAARGSARDVVVRGGEAPPEVVIHLGTGYVLKGRVVDAEKKPVAGAVVLGGRTNDAWDAGATASRARATADAEGRWKLENLDAGGVTLWVGRKGAVPAMRATVRVPSVTEYDLVLRPTGSIEGVVTQKETGKPVEGALVRASQWGWSVHVGEVTTDAAGHYRLDEFPTGDVQDLRAEKEGLVHVREDGAVPWMGGDRRVHAGDVLTVNLQMRRGAAVSGRVLAGGKGVAGAKVVLRGSGNAGSDPPRVAATDADGRYRIDGVSPGKAFGQVTREGYLQKDFPENWWMLVQDESMGAQFRVEVPETGEATLDLTLERGAVVTGRVEGPDGPVAGAQVNAPGAEATSGPDGAFRLEGVVPGEAVAITAAKKGLVAPRPETVAVATGAANPEVLLRLAAMPVVRGRVVGPDGGPVPGSRIAVVPKADEQNQGFNVQMFQNGDPADGFPQVPVREDGSFEAEVAMVAGGFAVRATAPDFGAATSDTIPLQEGRTTYQVDVRLAAAEMLRGRVMSGARGVAGADVSLERQREASSGMQMGMVFTTSGMGGPGAEVWAVTDAEGNFEVRPLDAGTWDATVTAAGFVKRKQEGLKVPSSGRATIQIDPALEIAGKVVLVDGSPAEGMTVMIQAADPSGMISFPGQESEDTQSTSDREGRFRLKGVPPGSHKLRVAAPWASRTNVRPATTPPIQAGTTDARIVLEAGGTIAGRVVDGERKPVAMAWITANPAQPDPEGSFHGGATKADGTFEIVGLGAGPYTLWAQSQTGGLQPTQKENVAVGTKDLEIVLATALSIDGVAVRADGKPAAGVMLQAEPVAEPGADATPNYGASVSPSDSEGRFHVAGLQPGKYRLRIAYWGGPASSLRVATDATYAAGSTGVRVLLVEGAKITGTVVDENGTAIAGAQVSANGDDGTRAAGTGKDGRFEIGGLGDGKYTVNGDAPGRVAVSLPDVASGTNDVRIVLVKGLAIAGRVLQSDGSALAGGQVQLMLGENGANGQAWAQTDAEGRFRADGLKEGTWAVVVLRPNPEKPDEWTQVPLGKVAAGTADVELRLPK